MRARLRIGFHTDHPDGSNSGGENSKNVVVMGNRVRLAGEIKMTMTFGVAF
jgi:hypothetical protein